MIFISSTQAEDAATEKPVASLMPEKHFATLEKYCLDCHDTATEEGEVNLEKLDFNIVANIETAETWQKILNAINSGEMPPKKKKQLTVEEKTVFLDDLSTQIVTARKILSDNGGVITLRRLNRREYSNTIEELLGIQPDITSLPDDQASAEFDTLGASLFFSSDQFEQYLATARKTLELALIPQNQPESKTVRTEPEEEYTQTYLEKAAELIDRAKRTYAYRASGQESAKEFGYLDGYNADKQLQSFEQGFPQLSEYIQRPETATGAALILTIKGGMTRIKLPNLGEREEGKYIIRVRAAAYPDVEERFQYLEFVAVENQNSNRLGWRKVTGTLKDPQIIEFPIEHPAGSKLRYFVHQRTHQDRADKNLWTIHREENGLGTPPGLWVDWAEMVGPEPLVAPVEAAAKILFEKPEDMDPGKYAKEVIHRFAARSFRGEEPPGEFLDKLFAQFSANLDKGQKQTEALIGPLSVILSSPSFLYMVESTGNEDSPTLTETELAVRLAYFLSSSPPDDELMKAAREGKLSDPKVLKEQTSRLLADAKIDRFVRGFTYQWLEMHRIDMFQFDGVQFPTFDNAARDSARKEMFETVKTLMAEKLPLKNLLKSDFVVINDILASYYGIPGVEGHEFRKVILPAESIRGGLLGTAAVSAMGSDGQRSSPVERGAWVLRHLMNTPPPPAPPNVPQLSRLDGQVLSARERQKAHQEEAQCAQCHRKIDPIGYGMENLNAAGLWRTVETVSIDGRGKKKETVEFPIDPKGSLYDGTEFSDFLELRDVVADRIDGFAQGLAEGLITYGLGRPYGFTDHDLAHEMVSQAKGGEYEITGFIHALVQSKAFRSK